QVALATKRVDIVKDVPNFDQKKFLFYLSRSEYEREWGKEYRRPGLFARILAFILKAVPKVGPFKALDYKIPTTQTEELYIKGMNKTVENYRSLLRAAGTGQLRLPDMDCDTGRPTQAGEYARCDETYGRLLDELSKNGFESISPELRQKILDFYAK